MDQRETLEQTRDLAEYAMAFHNYEAVKAVQEARDTQAHLEDEETTDIFLQQVESLLGRKLNKEQLEKARANAHGSPDTEPVQRNVPNARELIEEDIIRVSKPTKDK